ncbi:MAG: hypothetical protein QY332_17655 [Anaerolineales bacterium]|nr:MAG: hypothetical protein QY332_17655 [Anaerolineales bacterium]
MKKVLLISLALVLTACGVVQPVQQEQPTPVIATVLVTVVPPTEALPPTAIQLPTQEPTALPTEALAPTDVPQPTEVAGIQPASLANLNPVAVDFALGKGVFGDINFSSDTLSLRCFPREMEISMTAILPDIVRAEMFYRIVDPMQRTSEWFLVGSMTPDIKGNFSITFKATDINPDYRVLQTAWIDFQFAGVNRGGGVVDRTQKIEKLVTYYKECP